jgi:hypothetical protein
MRATFFVEDERCRAGVVALADPTGLPLVCGRGEVDPAADALADIRHGRSPLTVERERRLHAARDRLDGPAVARCRGERRAAVRAVRRFVAGASGDEERQDERG